MTISHLERYQGALLGLATGDAVGTTLEFHRPGTFSPIDDMVGGGPFGLRPGEWTDDTSMALCLAESLVEQGGFDPRDQMERYVRWWKEGYYSVTGSCFDIGLTVRGALQHFLHTDDPYAGPTSANTAGNGSLMRLAPVPLAYASHPREAITKAGESSRTTHGATTAVDACRYFAGLLVGAVQGVSKEELLADHYTPVPALWQEEPLHPAIAEIAAGSFTQCNPPHIQGTGYVVRSLEAALWAFSRSNNFRDGCLLAVNLGDDADTTGAIYGQLAGAYYGVNGIPEVWREKIAMRERILHLADGLATLFAGLFF